MGSVHAKGLKEEANSSSGNDDVNKVQSQYSKQEIVNNIPAKVERVHIDGLAITKDDVVMREVREIFKAKDFQEVIVQVHEAKMRLERLGIFRNIGIYIDTSQGPLAHPDGLEVTFFVRELRRVIGGIHTLVGHNEGSLVFSLRVPNLLGRAEKLQTEFSYGTKKSSGFQTVFIKPLQCFLSNASLSLGAYQSSIEIPWSGFGQTDRGLGAEFSFESAPKVQHILRWEGVWRELSCLSRATSFRVREEAGHSLKSSLRHSLVVDKRDNPIFPNTGALFRINQEFAGLGGDVKFLKHEIELQINKSLVLGSVLQGSLTAGVLKPLGDKDTLICDRFFLGGPLNLRGFSMRGVGAQSDGNALGAESYWAGALHLFTPLPFRPGKGGFGDLFRTHFFINAGNIGNFHFSDDYQLNIQTLLEDMRLSYGAGITLRLGRFARVELNYCIPRIAQKGDSLSEGVQFGIGVSFL